MRRRSRRLASFAICRKAFWKFSGKIFRGARRAVGSRQEGAKLGAKARSGRAARPGRGSRGAAGGREASSRCHPHDRVTRRNPHDARRRQSAGRDPAAPQAPQSPFPVRRRHRPRARQGHPPRAQSRHRQRRRRPGRRRTAANFTRSGHLKIVAFTMQKQYLCHCGIGSSI